VSQGAEVYRRTAAQASMVAPPFTQTRVSNHKPMRMECPLIAAALQTGERHMYLSMCGAAYEPGVYTTFVQKLSLTYYTHNCLGDSPILFCV